MDLSLYNDISKTSVFLTISQNPIQVSAEFAEYHVEPNEEGFTFVRLINNTGVVEAFKGKDKFLFVRLLSVMTTEQFLIQDQRMQQEKEFYGLSS